ncbi:MAG: YbdK family carboxylate-amine ligase [Sedimentisphaerales bacterium]|nr:YbdK family carboxylate-amine ligase [Sedimentisphaerales bacterium]
MKPFVRNDFPTVGVEQEFHLIDPETADLTPCFDEVKAQLDEELAGLLEYELFLAVLECKSRVFRTVDELILDVRSTRKALWRACDKVGVKLAAAGSHPFADWHKLEIVPTPHYQWVREQCVYLVQRLLSFGLHVHVGMQSVESAMYAMYEFRRWVYPLMALAANSPFYEGQRTGLASTRAHLFGSMPRTHLPPYFHDFSELEAFYEKLLAAGDITRPGDLWWALRPQPPLGTVEVRVFDLPTDIRRLGAFAAVTQAAMAYYQQLYLEGNPPARLDIASLEQNHWQAMRFGLDGNVIDAETGEVVPIRTQLSRLFDMISPMAEKLDAFEHLNFARELLDLDNESAWQVQFYQESDNDLRELELEIARRTVL